MIRMFSLYFNITFSSAISYKITRMLVVYFSLLLLGSALSQSTGYSQQWIRGEGPVAHPHEGIRLRDGSGWVTIGDRLPAEKSNAQEIFTVSGGLVEIYLCCL